MKSFRIIAIIGVLVCLPLSQVAAAKMTSEEKALIAAEIDKLYTIKHTAKKLDSVALAKITDAVLYDVEVEMISPDGSSSSEPIKLIRQGESFNLFARPSTNQKCPELLAMIKEDFKLKTEQDLMAMEAVLDLLYPIPDGFLGRDDLEVKGIRREGSSVVFIRGKFFDDLAGFVFATDEIDSIVDVSYSLGLKAGDQE